jgi:hypothetical protein
MLDVGRQLLAERPGILLAQIDLVLGAAEPEPHRLPGRPPSRSSSSVTIILRPRQPGLRLPGRRRWSAARRPRARGSAGCGRATARSLRPFGSSSAAAQAARHGHQGFRVGPTPAACGRPGVKEGGAPVAGPARGPPPVAVMFGMNCGPAPSWLRSAGRHCGMPMAPPPVLVRCLPGPGSAAGYGGGERWRPGPRHRGAAPARASPIRRGRAGCPGGAGRGRPAGGIVGGAGGRGHAGGVVKLAAISALNSWSSHCGSAQISSANLPPASCVVIWSTSITLPGTGGSVTRSMTDTVFL